MTRRACPFELTQSTARQAGGRRARRRRRVARASIGLDLDPAGVRLGRCRGPASGTRRPIVGVGGERVRRAPSPGGSNGSSRTCGSSAAVPAIASPRSTRSWATNAARGPRSSTGASSAHVWCWAATSVSGPIVNRPTVRRSRRAPRPRTRGGASRARRYSASVAAGQSCRPVSTAWRARSRSRSSPAQSRVDAAVVDHPHQTVEVAAVDQRVEVVVRAALAHAVLDAGPRSAATGSGDRSDRSGTTRSLTHHAARPSDRFDLGVVQQRGDLQRHPLDTASTTGASNASGIGSPPNSQITVRSLYSGAKQSPWSMPHTMPVRRRSPARAGSGRSCGRCCWR